MIEGSYRLSHVESINSGFCPFLAHLSWRLKWPFLIAHCPSSIRLYLNYFSINTGPILTKVDTKHFWGKGNSKLIKWRAAFFSKGDNGEIANIHWKHLKLLFFKGTEKSSNKVGTKHPCVKRIVCSNSGPDPFPKENNSDIKKITLTTWKIYLNIFRTTWPIESKLGTIQHWWRGFVCPDVGHAFLQKWMIAKSRNVDVIKKSFPEPMGPF